MLKENTKCTTRIVYHPEVSLLTGASLVGGGGGVKECVGPRGLGGPRSPGHREDRDIPFE